MTDCIEGLFTCAIPQTYDTCSCDIRVATMSLGNRIFLFSDCCPSVEGSFAQFRWKSWVGKVKCYWQLQVWALNALSPWCYIVILMLLADTNVGCYCSILPTAGFCQFQPLLVSTSKCQVLIANTIGWWSVLLPADASWHWLVANTITAVCLWQTPVGFAIC